MTTITTASRTRGGWTRRAAPLAAGWLGLWGVLALLCTLTGAGYPFGANDPHGGDATLLRLVPVDVGPPVFAVLLLGAAVAALAMSGGVATGLPRPLRALLLGYGWTVAFLLAVVVPDFRVLAFLGYLPVLIVGAPFGWPEVDYADIFTWSLFARFAAVVGGVLLAGAVLAWQRRTAAGCPACGRDGTDRDVARAATVVRRGRWATYVAAVIPALYAVTRLAWAVGVPLGIDRAFLDEMRDSGSVWAAAGLGAFALVGTALTLGLVQRWGERFPRWMPGLAGRRVPVALAVVPAGGVAVAVSAAGVGLLSTPAFWDFSSGVDLATAPVLLWPLWGAALAVATYAYHLRRRGACRRCGRH
ncbi:hypothetical protein [Micromonospora halophytica]|uniref:Uncharacterized protein n=1 Tax=Micromonospora halophytica TaxID=47864 RepID=A0A1C5HAW1_9ACTN|nr:hypothetical protein [Micromonospora halophytica]SCG43168.1 hypothetical protein GA0070560_103404 [Micromonospora halophytica]